MRRRPEIYSIMLACLLSVAVRSVVWAAGETIPIADAAWTTEGNQLEAYFGESITYAGDVNGDGYDVIIVGDQAACYSGITLSTAGDVDGDGYDDLIVGAMYYDGGLENEGRLLPFQFEARVALSASAMVSKLVA